MSPHTLNFALSAVSIIVTVAVCQVFVMFAKTFLGRTRAQPFVASAGYDSDALARLQSSVDAIAIEVERISEGQRFTTKLLSERSEAEKILV